MKYVIGWNVIGQSPDIEPREATNWHDALNMLRSELAWLSGDRADLHATIETVLDSLESASPNVITRRVGDYQYWICPKEIEFSDDLNL